MARTNLLDSDIVKGIGLLLAGGTVSLGLSVGLILYIWNEDQASAEEARAAIGRHSEEISQIKTSQAVVTEKLHSIESKLVDFRAYIEKEINRERR